MTAPRAADLRLVASAEPAVVFASLGQSCVSRFCDACTVDVVEGDAEGYRISYPGATTAYAKRRTVHRDFHSELRPDELPFHGRVVFGWDSREPTDADRAIADLILDRALATVALQRSEQRSRDFTAKVANLKSALQTSRHIGAAIGILMATHQITSAAAFDLLRQTSQLTHRKLREVALDVIDAGWLDPVVLASTVGAKVRATVRPGPPADGSLARLP